MAYLSSTTTSPNVPYLVTQGIAFSSSNVTGSATQTGIPRTWYYNSTHLSTDIGSVNFFTDAVDLGFKVGDLVIHTEQQSSGLTTAHRVLVVGSTTTDCGAGTTVGAGS
jgi:hypothetical protein